MTRPTLPEDMNVFGIFNGVTAKKRITLDKAIEVFLDECKLKELRPTTIENYERQISVFRDFCDSEGIFTNDLFLFTTDHVRAFQSHLKATGIKNSSINAYCKSCEILFTNMERKGYVKENPFKGEKLRNGQQKLGFTPSKEDVKRLINYQIDKAQGNFVQYRNLVILVMLLDTGIRVNELSELHRTDIHVEETGKEYVNLRHTKNARNRRVGLSARLVNLLKVYLPLVENFTSPFLFNSKPNQKLARRSIQIYIKQLGHANGLPELSCHACRRFYASVKISEGIPLIQLMRLLGHSSPLPTMRYIEELGDGYLEWKDTGIE